MPDFTSGSSTPMRRACRGQQKGTNSSSMPLKADIDPPPKPWPFSSAIAVVLVLFFLSLQFILPVTHIRHPADPHRVWLPVENLKFKSNWSIESPSVNSDEDRGTLIVFFTKEENLRPLFVLINSTVSNTQEPERLHFLAIVPSTVPNSESLKLRTVFSNLNIEMRRDDVVIEKAKSLMVPEIAREKNSDARELLPFYLPKLITTFSRFVYIEADAALQADIEELIQLDMEGKPFAAVEDCSQIFETYFAMDLLEASRLSSGNRKPQLPSEPFQAKTCFFDRGTFVIDGRSWNQNNITEIMHWWISMHYKTGESLYSNLNLGLPAQLALYQYYMKIDPLWSVREPLNYQKAGSAKLIHFDKEHKPWHQRKPTNFGRDITSLWWKYLSPSTNAMFNM